MAQTVFLVNNIDPQQLARQKEIRQTVQFPLNGRYLRGPGTNAQLNAYVKGLFQPVNVNNPFDPVSEIGVPLSNYMGLTGVFGKNPEGALPFNVKDVYCNASGLTLYKVGTPINGQHRPAVPSSLSSLSPFFSSFSPSMNLVGLYGITRIPFFDGYFALALYSDLVLRPPGAANGQFRELTSNTNPDLVLGYGKLFNNNSLPLVPENNAATTTVNVYHKLVVLKSDASVHQVLDFPTNFFDNQFFGKSNDLQRLLMPLKLGYYGMADISYVSNPSTIQYFWQKYSLGQAVNMSEATAAKIKASESPTLACQEELARLMFGANRLFISYGKLDVVAPTRYIPAYQPLIDWCVNAYPGMLSVHVSAALGVNSINLGFIFDGTTFYTTANYPSEKINLPDLKLTGNFTYPFAYGYSGYDTDSLSSPLVYAYCSTSNTRGLLYEPCPSSGFRLDDVISLQYNGARYSLDRDGSMVFSLGGAATTTPLSDESVLSQGQCFYKYNDRNLNPNYHYLWQPEKYPSGSYPYPWPLISLTQKLTDHQAGNQAYFDRGGKMTPWMAPSGVDEKTI
jgi:hypothetical protein